MFTSASHPSRNPAFKIPPRPVSAFSKARLTLPHKLVHHFTITTSTGFLSGSLTILFEDSHPWRLTTITLDSDASEDALAAYQKPECFRALEAVILEQERGNIDTKLRFICRGASPK